MNGLRGRSYIHCIYTKRCLKNLLRALSVIMQSALMCDLMTDFKIGPIVDQTTTLSNSIKRLLLCNSHLYPITATWMRLISLCIIDHERFCSVLLTSRFCLIEFLQQASSQSFGYFIPQASPYGNLILPVLPRIDSNGRLISPQPAQP